MATFATKRKYNRQPKVSDDNENKERPPKRQRRGVSVFQRQLYKRKMWVEEYEAGKDQKRRDKRKVMRGYYRALKALDREHKQIFGDSVSTRSRRRAKKNGTYYDHYQKNQHKKDLKYKQKDVWNELKRPSYSQKFRNSNWNFMNTKRSQTDDARFKYKTNKKYRGNGVINYGNKSVAQETEDNYDDSNTMNTNNKNYKNKFIGNVRLNSYQKAMMERSKIINEREEMHQQKKFMQQERKQALDRFEQQRQRRHKILSMKNKRGQPNLNAQMSLLLEKIQDARKKTKRMTHSHDSNTAQNQIQHEQNDDSDEVNEFLND